VNELEIPKSIEIEHKQLHNLLSEAIESGGATGDAAKTVAAILAPHFKKEEQFALPQLGLLRSIAEGKEAYSWDKVLRLSEKLKNELGQMLQEHKAIVFALNNLVKAASKEKKNNFVEFAEKLALHAQAEEEIFYPASIIVAEYVKLQSKQSKLGTSP
jgi:hypothetical protein